MQRPHYAHAGRVRRLSLWAPRLQYLNLNKHIIFKEMLSGYLAPMRTAAVPQGSLVAIAKFCRIFACLALDIGQAGTFRT